MSPLLLISQFSALVVQELWQDPCILTTHIASNTFFHHFYPLSARASVCLFVNKFLNPSFYSTLFPTLKNSYVGRMCCVGSVKNVVIYNINRMKKFFPTSSKYQLSDMPL
jgi:hypothetical protein